MLMTVMLVGCTGMTVTVPYKGMDFTVTVKPQSGKEVVESPLPVEVKQESYLDNLWNYFK